MRRVIVDVLFVGLVAVGTGCGDDGGSETEAETGNLSREEFARKANALCAEAAADRRTILSGIEEETGEETAAQLDAIVTIDEKLLRDVDDLVPPEVEQETIDQLLDAWRERIDLEKQARAAAAAGDEVTLGAVSSQIDDVDTRADPIAGGLLLNECTRGEPSAGA